MLKLKLVLMSMLMMLMVVGVAAAQTPGAGDAGADTHHWFVQAIGPFAVGFAAFGGSLGDGRAIAAACEGTARNPGAGGRIFTMLILGLALIETLVLFTFLAFYIQRGA